MRDNFTTSGTAWTNLPREQTLANRVTTQVEQYIVQNKLEPGMRLPSERELAEQFSVSRTVIREAVRALVTKGLLEVRHGSGTLIRAPSRQSVSESFSRFLHFGQPGLEYHKVIEVRRLLEVEIAGLAAARRTTADLVELGALIHELPKIAQDGEELIRNDLSFHAALAKATQNEIHVLLLDSIGDILRQVRQVALEVPNRVGDARTHHPAIFEHIVAGNVDGARDAMRAHMDEAEATMRQAFALIEQRAQKP